MAQLQVADIVTYVQDYIPDKPQAKIVRAANLVIQRIYREADQNGRSTFTTRAPTSTGTVSVTNGSTAVTFSSPVLSSTDKFMMIQFPGDRTWFNLTYVSTTTGTLSSAYTGTTNATSTYTICYPCVTFPTNVLKVNSMWLEGFQRLRYAADQLIPQRLNMVTTAKPEFYSPFLTDSSTASPDNDQLRLMLTPAPDQAYAFNYTYKYRPVLLTPGGSTSQVVTLPDYFNEAILDGTLFFCWDQEDKADRSAYWQGVYEQSLKKAMAENNLMVATRFEDGYDANDWGLYEQRPIG